MVNDRKTVSDFIRKYCFGTDNDEWSINPHTGLVDVITSVIISSSFNFAQLPVSFGETSYFDCSSNHLRSLTGCPQMVSDAFDCSNNNLDNLLGGPRRVEGYYDCSSNPLVSLEGAPDHVGGKFLVDYAPHLPLLKLCLYPELKIYDCPVPVKTIFEKYAGTGRPGALKAAAELIREGYRDNARW